MKSLQGGLGAASWTTYYQHLYVGMVTSDIPGGYIFFIWPCGTVMPLLRHSLGSSEISRRNRPLRKVGSPCACATTKCCGRAPQL
eukprot:7970578-Pyramimonas_sp.AAC.1